jgi:hypothetical protein
MKAARITYDLNESTFSRASAAYYQSGLNTLGTSPAGTGVNSIRYPTDSVSGALNQGMLLEPSGTNLLNPYILLAPTAGVASLSTSNLTVTQNYTQVGTAGTEPNVPSTAPNATYTVSRLRETTVTGEHYAQLIVPTRSTDTALSGYDEIIELNTDYVFSMYVRTEDAREIFDLIAIRFASIDEFPGITPTVYWDTVAYNLFDGTHLGTTTNSHRVTHGAIRLSDATNSWIRIYYSWNTGGTSIYQPVIQLGTGTVMANIFNNRVGSSTYIAWVWGMQLEKGTYPSSFMGDGGTRAADIFTTGIYSDLPAGGDTVWSPTTTYVATNEVVMPISHKTYECIASAVGTAQAPESDASDTYWTQIDYTNNWKMFASDRGVGNTMNSTVSTNGNSLHLAFTGVSRHDLIVILGMKNVTKCVVNVYDTTNRGINSRVYSNTSTFTAGTMNNIALDDLPSTSSFTVNVSLYNSDSSSKISCGYAGIGKAYDIGRLEVGSELDTLNFSSVTRDTYGSAALVPRRNIPRTVHKLVSNKSNLDFIHSVRDLLGGEICLWYGMSNDVYTKYIATVGIYKNFTITTPAGDFIQINLEIESL